MTSDIEDRPGPRIDAKVEVERLAKLTALEYEQERLDAAKRLGIRTSVLDAEVERARPRKSEDDEEPFEVVDLWPHVVDGADLLDEVQKMILRFSVLPDHSAPLIAAWILHAWSHDCADISPVLAAVSPEKRCGKTTLLGTISALVPRPLSAVNISASVLFRVIEKHSPTILIDEADTFLIADKNGDIRGMLNGGHNRMTSFVWRSVGDDHEPRRFKVWAPKAIAMIGRLPDTLEDRALVIHLRRKYPGEKVERFRFDRVQGFLPLRRRAARWVSDHASQLRSADPSVPDQLHDRAQDNARCICAIADVAGGRWPGLVREALIGTASQVDDEPQSMGVVLLRDIGRVFDIRRGEDPDRLGSSELVAKLCALAEAPWMEWRSGKPMSAQGVAKLLRPFGVRPAQDRYGSYYRPADFADAFLRYLPHDPGKTATTATTATPPETATKKIKDINGRGSCGTYGSSMEDGTDDCHGDSSVRANRWSDERIDHAVNGAKAAFDVLNDPRNPDVWA